MIVFKITYASDKKSYAFSDLKKFMTLTNKLFENRFSISLNEILVSGPEMAPDYLCVQNYCSNLPPKYQHVAILKIQIQNANDIYLFSRLYADFCTISFYRFELDFVAE